MRVSVIAIRVATTLAIVALVALAVAVGALWFATSEEGLRWASGEAAARSGGRLKIEGESGSLGGIVRIARLTYADEDMSLVAEDVAFRWSPRTLLFRTIVVDTLSAASVATVPAEDANIPREQSKCPLMKKS